MFKYVLKLFCIFSAGLIIGAGATNKQAETEKTVKSGYIIRIENSGVNVYKLTEEGETFEKRIDEANVFDLPDRLMEELKKGIFISGTPELEKIIEEITS